MSRTTKVICLLLAVGGLPLALSVESSHATSSIGRQTDTACQASNGTTPFADKSCALCHTSPNPSTGDLNQNGQSFRNGNITAICPVTATAPVADAGLNQLVTAGTTVTLDGSKSIDSGGHALTFQWTLTTVPSGSGATLSNLTSAKPTFLADKAGQYVAQLVVNNGTLSSTPASVTITTNPINTPPAANAGPNQTVPVGTTVTLDGSGSSDANGNLMTYLWSFKSVPAGSPAAGAAGPYGRSLPHRAMRGAWMRSYPGCHWQSPKDLPVLPAFKRGSYPRWRQRAGPCRPSTTPRFRRLFPTARSKAALAIS